ncbi:conjugal transfer protein [Antribacter sp. KLBMP9083]|uniref:Conjugal transfer protein n=1 Tax=Antribacter soli TaxID=2910976 RepID=A0AA41QE23_9MICO|nr:conjugal transfer protein [Antribacter soli]MCF4120417.1 conjugal transfer protein [Antribacter soli]
MSSVLDRRRDRRAAPATLPAGAEAGATRAPGASGPTSGSPVAPGEEPPQVLEWTQGPALVTKAWAIGLALAIAAGPIALAWVLLRPATTGPATTGGGADYAASAAAGERATELVETWLRADRDDQQLVDSLTSAPVGQLPDTGLTIRDSSVASVAQTGDQNWSVTVGVDVAEPAPGAAPPAEGQAPALVWVRRYFRVPVHVAVSEEALAVEALALPAPVPAPATAEAPDLDYPHTISPTSAAGESVASFLAAMVAGQGEISRYTRPGAAIAAVTPAPYTAVAVKGLVGSHEISDDPADGDGSYVLATVDLTRPDGQKTTAQYAVTLIARDGRWEVAGLDQAVRTQTPVSGSAGQENEGEN